MRGWEGEGIHQRMRKPHFGSVDGAISRGFQDGEVICVFGIEDNALEGCLHSQYVSMVYDCGEGIAHLHPVDCRHLVELQASARRPLRDFGCAEAQQEMVVLPVGSHLYARLCLEIRCWREIEAWFVVVRGVVACVAGGMDLELGTLQTLPHRTTDRDATAAFTM